LKLGAACPNTKSDAEDCVITAAELVNIALVETSTSAELLLLLLTNDLALVSSTGLATAENANADGEQVSDASEPLGAVRATELRGDWVRADVSPPCDGITVALADTVAAAAACTVAVLEWTALYG